MTTETTSRQAFAARRAQERCEREGTPDRFTEHFTAECAAIRVDPHAVAFDRKGRRGQELLGRVMTSLRRRDPDLADELSKWLGGLETIEEHDERDKLSRREREASATATEKCCDRGEHTAEAFQRYYSEALDAAA